MNLRHSESSASKTEQDRGFYVLLGPTDEATSVVEFNLQKKTKDQEETIQAPQLSRTADEPNDLANIDDQNEILPPKLCPMEDSLHPEIQTSEHEMFLTDFCAEKIPESGKYVKKKSKDIFLDETPPCQDISITSTG